MTETNGQHDQADISKWNWSDWPLDHFDLDDDVQADLVKLGITSLGPLYEHMQAAPEWFPHDDLQTLREDFDLLFSDNPEWRPKPLEADEQPEQPEEPQGDYTKREQAHYHEITQLNLRVRIARSSWEDSKEETSRLKKNYDRLVDELTDRIAIGPDPQGKLPFGDDEAASEEADPEPDDSWKDVPVSEALSLTAKQLERLEEAGVTRMGHLEDLRAGEGLLSIKGFGQAAVDKIEDQVIEWLTENRDKFGEPASEEDAESDASEETEEAAGV